jgi:hypothetical protein
MKGIKTSSSPAYMLRVIEKGLSYIKWFLLYTAILILVRGGCKGYFISLT